MSEWGVQEHFCIPTSTGSFCSEGVSEREDRAGNDTNVLGFVDLVFGEVRLTVSNKTQRDEQKKTPGTHQFAVVLEFLLFNWRGFFLVVIVEINSNFLGGLLYEVSAGE